MNVEEFCILLAEKSGFSFGDIYNMDITEIKRLTKIYFNKDIVITLNDEV